VDGKGGFTPRDGEQGYALLMVLIAVGLIAILLGEIESGAHTEAKIATGLRDQAQAQAAADGAIWQAAWQVLPGRDASWPADASGHEITVGDAAVEVSAEDLGGRVDLNRDSAEAVAVALQSLGLDGGRALMLGRRLTDWRGQNTEKQPLGAKGPEYRAAGLPYGPPNADYENIAEIELVLGMTPDIARALAPHVTIYSFGQPRLAAARNALELEALKTALRSQPAPASNPPAVFFYSLTARAQVGSATAMRTAVLRVDMNASNEGKFWRVLDWN
jgi:general secretion pathway protein K